MAYSILNNGTAYRSHLTGRVYEFTGETKNKVFGDMLVDDNDVRDAAQKRFVDAGGSAKRKLSDREIAAGNFIPDVRSATERVCDTLASQPSTRHDVFAVGIDTIRAQMRSTDSAATREANEIAIERLATKSEAFQQQLAARPPAEDPTSPAATATAMRKAADDLVNSFSGTPAERARFEAQAATLLKQADALDAKAEQEKQLADKLADASGAIADSATSLYLLAKDPETDQATINAIRDVHERLKSGNATKQEWWALVERVDGERAARKQAKLDANSEERKRLEAERASIKADEPPAAAETVT
jgi:hypothetical protein